MRIIAAALLTLCFVSEMRGETLADVLTSHQIPPGILRDGEGRQSITSFAVSRDNLPFLLAYYDDDGSSYLPPALHVMRYDSRTKELRRTDLELTEKDENFRGVDHRMGSLSSICIGSASNISEADGFVTIDTHINPSAGCVLILNSDLVFSAVLFGWVMAKIDGDIIFQENTIHFAPTHPSGLSLYNPRTKELNRIYPAKTDVERKRFSRNLAHHLPSDKWCAENNNPCNPEKFTVDIGPVLVNEREHSFTFDAQMSADNFGDDAERLVKTKTVHYVCTLKNDKWLLTSE